LATNGITGAWILDRIPEPTLPLRAIGKRAYDKFRQLLYSQNKLTEVTLAQAKAAAAMWEKIYVLLSQFKQPSANAWTQFNRAVGNLQIAEGAQNIATPGKKSKFETFGVPAGRNSQIELRGYGKTGSS